MLVSKPIRQATRRQRAGTVYVAVLGVTLIVGVMASVAMTLARVDLRMNRTAGDLQDARRLASAAVEYGANYLQNDSAWRENFPIDTEFGTTAWGGGETSWRLTDTDGALDDDPRDSVVLSGIGKVGDAVAVESVTLIAKGEPLTCLEVAVLSNESIALANGSGLFGLLPNFTRIESNQIVASNADVYAYGYRKIDAAVEAGGTAAGNITPSPPQVGAALRLLPNEHAFDYYKMMGTWIPITNFLTDGDTRVMQSVVVSPTSNPYGATNAEGIYVIDCQGEDFCIRHVRVVGTLVLLNAGSGSGITSASLFEPAVANYPVLLVEGHFSLDTSISGNHSISESTAGISLNPPGVPYQGAADDDLWDTLPSQLDGLTYISGTTYVADDSRVNGVLVTDRLVVNSQKVLTVNYRDVYFRNPPPGFAGGDAMQIIPGSWRRDTY